MGEMERMASGEHGQRKIFAVVIVVARTVISKGISHAGDLTASTRPDGSWGLSLWNRAPSRFAETRGGVELMCVCVPFKVVKGTRLRKSQWFLKTH